MFANHANAFTQFQPAIALPAATPSGCALLPATLVETRKGWCAASTLRRGDAVSTLDGGFVEITGLSHDRGAAGTWHLPAGALDNCSDLMLSGDQFVALDHPALIELSEAPCVLAPVSALSGFRGIAKLPDTGPITLVRLGFAEEEMIYAQSGTLIHARGKTETGFFPQLNYGQTRAALTLMGGGLCAPDHAAA